MKTFLMVNDDYVLDDTNNLVMIDGNDEIRQSIERILTTNIEEWFLNVGFGLDYRAIQGKGKTNAGIEMAIRQAIFQDSRIDDVEFLKLNIDSASRTLKTILKIYGTEENLKQILDEIGVSI